MNGRLRIHSSVRAAGLVVIVLDHRRKGISVKFWGRWWSYWIGQTTFRPRTGEMVALVSWSEQTWKKRGKARSAGQAVTSFLETGCDPYLLKRATAKNLISNMGPWRLTLNRYNVSLWKSWGVILELVSATIRWPPCRCQPACPIPIQVGIWFSNHVTHQSRFCSCSVSLLEISKFQVFEGNFCGALIDAYATFWPALSIVSNEIENNVTSK